MTENSNIDFFRIRLRYLDSAAINNENGILKILLPLDVKPKRSIILIIVEISISILGNILNRIGNAHRIQLSYSILTSYNHSFPCNAVRKKVFTLIFSNACQSIPEVHIGGKISEILP